MIQARYKGNQVRKNMKKGEEEKEEEPDMIASDPEERAK